LGCDWLSYVCVGDSLVWCGAVSGVVSVRCAYVGWGGGRGAGGGAAGVRGGVLQCKQRCVFTRATLYVILKKKKERCHIATVSLRLLSLPLRTTSACRCYWPSDLDRYMPS
jgi:hypothetical protein